MQRTILTLAFALLLIVPAGAAHGAPGDIIDQFPSPGCSPSGLGWNGTSLWIANLRVAGACAIMNVDRVTEHDPVSFAQLSFFDMPTGPPDFFHNMAFDSATEFFTDDLFSDIVKSDTAGTVSNRFAAQGLTYGVAYNPLTQELIQIDFQTGELWILDSTNGNVVSGPTATAVDFTGGQILGTAWDGAALWVVASGTDQISRVDITNGSVMSVFAAPGNAPSGIAWDDACLWVSDTSAEMIYRIDHGEPSLPTCPPPVVTPDAGVDAGTALDGGTDAGGQADAAAPDAAPQMDAAPQPDAGSGNGNDKGCDCATGGPAAPTLACFLILGFALLRRRRDL